MKYKLILNPYAHRWGAQERAPLLEAALAAADLTFDLVVTKSPGHGTQEAYTAGQEGYDAVIAGGGDGTISEIVNGLVAATSGDAPTLPLGILPVGTANDFSDMVKIPRDLAAAVDIIAAGHVRRIDAGQITAGDDAGQDTHFFNNNSAVAMEPMVTLENIKMTRLSGEIRYMVALVRSLIKLKAWDMRITWDDGEYVGPTYLLSVCNGPRTGGFYMAPTAVIDDGLFDFVLAPEVPKKMVLAILFRLLRSTHIDHPQVTYARTTHLSVESQPGTPIHADGEIISELATRIAYQVLPGKISLLCPAGID